MPINLSHLLTALALAWIITSITGCGGETGQDLPSEFDVCIELTERVFKSQALGYGSPVTPDLGRRHAHAVFLENQVYFTNSDEAFGYEYSCTSNTIELLNNPQSPIAIDITARPYTGLDDVGIAFDYRLESGETHRYMGIKKLQEASDACEHLDRRLYVHPDHAQQFSDPYYPLEPTVPFIQFRDGRQVTFNLSGDTANLGSDSASDAGWLDCDLGTAHLHRTHRDRDPWIIELGDPQANTIRVIDSSARYIELRAVTDCASENRQECMTQ